MKVAIASRFERSCHRRKRTETALKTANTHTHTCTYVHAPHPLHDACTYTPIHIHAGIEECKTRRCPHTLTHAYYMHDIRIQNRDAHTDSQTHKRTYVTSPTYVKSPECEAVEQLQWWETVHSVVVMSWCSRHNTRVTRKGKYMCLIQQLASTRLHKTCNNSMHEFLSTVITVFKV